MARLTGGTRGFIEAHSDPADQQQVLPFGSDRAAVALAREGSTPAVREH